ncbi:DUF1403 family protein [Chelatococcus composti]|uniref:DUF1403 domain-containing protein n=1 Tax=Chelatococcus composti TaxID=1743235 RepID=A0A841K8G6_9HYPH|nr:DUF1403 family protein [Chelatococcus composti]MBB6168797.1 hypothetical protein [Chelatococcus composti]MBS7737404.1 DUF1403 family protein [Chelatococcus composti]GGG42931.1 hypothetical protein GCM10008026_24810 [Chelatococcus composti]
MVYERFAARPVEPPPAWVRAAGAVEEGAAAAFRAGAALALLHAAASADHDLGILWRQRCALRAAVAHVALAGRHEDEAALRDSWYLRRSGDDPGPGGRILGLWRRLAEPVSLRPQAWPRALREAAPAAGPEMLERLAAAAADAASAARGFAPAAAAGAVAAVLQERADLDGAALWLADAVLARQLGWPAPVPLIAPQVRRADLRLAARPDGREAWLRVCCLAYQRAALEALDLYRDLARRAERLVAAAPRLRTKAAAGAVALLLREDAAKAADVGQGVSDRAGRRLFERLVALGAVRELTGRPSFRLYGL